LRSGSPHGPFSEVPTVSVICGDLEASRRFYGDLLGLVPVNDAETPEQYRDLVCDLTGVPHGNRVHFLLYAAPGEASGKILLVHFYGASRRRLTGRMHPGNLGFVMLTHHTQDLDALHRALAGAGHDIVTPPTEVAIGTDSRRLMLVRGPNEELFEFAERR
jgi:catechol 2,3-dioxygenase-like lactoylglutathione lyase family enzyme